MECVRALVVLDVLLVFAVFIVAAGRPVPDTNEAHYLTKARHFWDPQWIAGDQFLDSADSHVVFYATFGWLTKVASLEQAAWCGRIAIWLLMACGWTRLSRNFAPGAGWAALTAAAALSLNEHLRMSGEWFVGGCEAKGVAYACVFWGLADLTAGRWNRAFIALGLGSAFHVLVGGWSVAAALGVLLADRRARPAFSHFFPGLCLGGLIALAGVVPGLALSRGADPAAIAVANQTYVFERLAHHLWARAFVPAFVVRQLLLWGLWATICLIVHADGPRLRLRWFALASIVISGIGFAISFASPQPTALAASLLKFYWFRLSDVAVTVSFVLELATLAAALPVRSVLRNVVILFMLAAGTYHFATVWQERRADAGLPRGEEVLDMPTLERWEDVCAWIARETPRDALVLSPRAYTTFKWRAERAEFVTWKDIPQDANSLVEWRTRLNDLYGPDVRWVNYVEHDRLREVCRKYKITHVVTYLEPTLPFDEIYRNDVFVVYRVPQP